MDWLIRQAVRYRVAVLLLAAGLCVAGVWTTLETPVDVFPDLTAPTVAIITEAGGAAATDVEWQVTFPIESVMSGARGVRRVRSLTGIGVSVVWVEFEWDVSMRDARQTVAERLSLVRAQIPEDVGVPFMAPESSIMGDILFVGILAKDGADVGEEELRSLAEIEIRRRLLSVPGVAQVAVLGGLRKEYQVHLFPNRLLVHGIGLADVARALRASNENRTAGFAEAAGTQYVVRGEGLLRTLDDIRDTVVEAHETAPVTVRDLADVRTGGAPRIGVGAINGRPGVVVSVQKQPGVNTLQLSESLDEALDDIESRLPPDVRLARDLFEQRSFIDVAVRNVFHALRDGSILVVVIMIIFLANVRATLITLLAIPLSLFAAVIVLEAWGESLNTMTLGGFAIAIGALVDDAVIDVENIVRRLRENRARPPEERSHPLRVVVDASIEIRSSIVFATFIVILVFVPLFFLGGIEGRLLRPLGVAYTVSLLASLIVAITVTPVLCYYLLARGDRGLRDSEPRFAALLKSAYRRILEPLLDRPAAVLAPTVVLFLGALVAGGFWGRSFLPDFNEGNLTVTAIAPAGTSLEQSSAMAALVEDVFLRYPEVVSIARRTGRSEGDEHVQGPEGSELEVVLSGEGRPKEELLRDLRADLARIPGLNIAIGQPISHRIDHMLSGTEAAIAVKIFGPDLFRLRSIAERVESAVRSVPGAVDVRISQPADVPDLRVRFDRARLARHGIGVADAQDSLETAFRGHSVGRILEGNILYDLVIRFADEGSPDPARLERVPVFRPDGGQVPLREVARIVRDDGPGRIDREQNERVTVVQANVAGRDLGSVVDDIERVVDPIVAAERAYRVEYGGQLESAREAAFRIGIFSAIVVVAVVGLLHLAFGSIRDALFVMVNLPLALIGAVPGVYLSGGTLSIPAMIGFITVFGIATRNGILLVSHFRHLREVERVTDLREEVVRGASERLIPVLMTALGTALALVPLALAADRPGNEIQAPMAIVILCGLLSSTLLNMVVVPVLWWWRRRREEGTGQPSEETSS